MEKEAQHHFSLATDKDIPIPEHMDIKTRQAKRSEGP